MKLKRLKKSTCFGIGAAGAVAAFLGGLLMLLNYGVAQYAHTAALILTGAMLLLAATMEKGAQNRGVRLRLLLLFFLLLIANLRLPLLDLLEVPVVSLFALWCGQKSDGKLVFPLLGWEVALAVLRTLAITPVLGPFPLRFVGAVLMTTAMLRFAVLLRLNRRAAKTSENPANERHSLR